MPKQNPYFIPKENYKKVEEVRFWEEKELITPEKRTQIIDFYKERQDLINNKSKLSPAARTKLVKKYGSDYLSERAFTNDVASMQMYGPGFWGDVGGFIGKTVATTAAAGLVITTAGAAAPLVGAGLWVGGKAVEEVGKSTDNRALRSIGSFAKDTGFGSITAITFADPGFVQKLASIGIRNGEKFKKAYEWLERGMALIEIEEHFEHQERGTSYKRNCDICNL